MPLVIWVVYRIAKAFAATGRLLFDVKLMRSLPWDYLRRLPRIDPWIGILVAVIALGIVALPLVLALPQDAASVAYDIALWPLIAGIVSTWVRALHQRRKLRGS